MKILADESIDRQIVERLRKEGHSVIYVAEMTPGVSDDKVLETSNAEQALLLTADKDFGELVFRQKRHAFGVVLIRIAGISPSKKCEIVSDAFNKHQTEIQKMFTVITPGYVRFRKYLASG